MHQHPRPLPLSSTSATKPSQKNPSSQNVQQNAAASKSRMEANASHSDEKTRGDAEFEGELLGQPSSELKTYYNKVNQVIQQFFIKAALTIISSRITIPQIFGKNGEVKQNKWFNVVLDDTDVFLDDIMEWRHADAVHRWTPPLEIEIYLDMTELSNNQALVLIDDTGRKWGVAETLNPPVESGVRPPSQMGIVNQVILERWKIEAGHNMSPPVVDLQEPLTNVYKKAVLLFRSLYTYSRVLPSWKYHRRISKHVPNQPSLKLKYRIRNGDYARPKKDTLDIPFVPNNGATIEECSFGSTSSPVGPLCIFVKYRTNCEFRVEDAESMLSSHFIGLDDNCFKPSLAANKQDVRAQPGSLPLNKNDEQEQSDFLFAYGSMSTFHQDGAQTCTSPLSVLRQARDNPLQYPVESPPQKNPSNHRLAQASKSSLRSAESGPTYQRRTSVSFQPFKAGSLLSSPAVGQPVSASPGTSVGKSSITGPLAQGRNRNSANVAPAVLRTPSLTNETAFASSVPTSPKPAHVNRYSSSFSRWRSKFSSGGSKMEDDNISSGKGSLTSSAQRGSDFVLEGEDGSPRSVWVDEENISSFLKLLEQKKDLKSFHRTDSPGTKTRRTISALSKYQKMKDANTEISDSISSSLMLHRQSISK